MNSTINEIKKELEKLGYTVIERDNTLVLSQELQECTKKSTMDDGSIFYYAPPISESESGGTMVNSEINNICGKDWYFECEYEFTFKLYEV